MLIINIAAGLTIILLLRDIKEDNVSNLMKVSYAFIIGFLRPIVVTPLVISGYLLSNWFKELVVRHFL